MKKVLFIGAHTDDIEISCAGTIQYLRGKGYDIILETMSYCGDQTLIDECLRSTYILNFQVNERFTDDFKVREFDKDRQKLLDYLIRLREEFKPEIVFVHSANCIHQDHSAVGREALRAFREQSIFTYCSPYNSLNMDENAFFPMTEYQLGIKLKALSCYKSQAHRPYMQPEVVRANAITRGLQSGFELAEAFKVVKLRNPL